MTADNWSGLGLDASHKTRFMSNLLMQIKADYKELLELCEGLKRGGVDREKIEEILGIISYLKKDLKVFEEMKRRGIEGIQWGQIEDIENDVFSKERSISIMLMTGFGEPVNTHLR